MVRVCGALSVLSAKAMQKEPSAKMLKVVVVPCNSNQFAIVFSLNHGVSDGHTYYKIYSMLGGGTVEILNAE